MTYTNVFIGRELVLTEREQIISTRISEDTKPASIEGKKAVMIYHRATNKFYGTIVKDPYVFYRRLNPASTSHSKLALMLQDILKISPVIDFFFTEVHHRAEFENAFARQGIRRVATARGAAMKAPSDLWEVRSTTHVFSRWISAPSNTAERKLIETAEKGLATFLRSCNRNEETLQERMRVYCHWNAFGGEKIFDINPVVYNHGQMPVNVVEYSKYTHDRNIEEMMRVTRMASFYVRPKYVTVIFAKSNNSVFGVNNTIPWKSSCDLKWFKKITLGNVVIMGRNTFESLPGGPLKGRLNVVITRTKEAEVRAKGAVPVASLHDAFRFLSTHAPNARWFVIGGPKLIEHVLPYTNEIFVSTVDTVVDTNGVDCVMAPSIPRHFRSGNAFELKPEHEDDTPAKVMKFINGGSLNDINQIY